ncbi:hypothetical protein P8C59_007946 [Phyllachora maydis]|uniref:Nascent polypeptide-associated complex subunit alpha-like UBA domain-containing protein n=1 Tax=Phyllachora maydis TaxID=1825666 RepID=A0AAD9I9K9_9PEZI|nr:hypothetical protein P8C59_007946 [Phyllachora maydis]
MAEEKQAAGGMAEGATTGDVEDEIEFTAKSAEDRKAAAALSKLDTREDDEAAPAREVDEAAVSRAMDTLGGSGMKQTEQKEVKKVKVDPADVALVVEELELTKAKATELLKAHDGDAVKAMRAFIQPVV